MARLIHYRVAEAELPKSLGAYLRERGFSASMLTAMKQQGGVTVNGGFHRMIDPLHGGDAIEVRFDRAETTTLIANPALELDVLYEDEDVAVIDKKDDMLVHPAGFGFDDAVGNFFAARYPGLAFRPVGRLDRHTTGLCVVAKNRLAAVCLTGAIEKEYFAVAEGQLAADRGTVDAPLLRVPGSVIMRRVAAEGKPSVTHFEVLRRLADATFLRLWLETGRTHQIRVHMQHLGHPLCGDSLYGGSTARIGRQALHCGSARFRQPVSGEPITVTSPLPPDMETLLRG